MLANCPIGLAASHPREPAPCPTREQAHSAKLKAPSEGSPVPPHSAQCHQPATPLCSKHLNFSVMHYLLHLQTQDPGLHIHPRLIPNPATLLVKMKTILDHHTHAPDHTLVQQALTEPLAQDLKKAMDTKVKRLQATDQGHTFRQQNPFYGKPCIVFILTLLCCLIIWSNKLLAEVTTPLQCLLGKYPPVLLLLLSLVTKASIKASPQRNYLGLTQEQKADFLSPVNLSQSSARECAGIRLCERWVAFEALPACRTPIIQSIYICMDI